MAESYVTTTPSIDSAVFSENPTTINQKIVLTVYVSEQTVYLEAELRYAGEFYAGEV